MVSRWKKSVASSPAAWARRNVGHWVSIPRGAGPRRAPVRMRRIVPAPTWCPRRVSSPWMRRCPQRIVPCQANDEFAELVVDAGAAGRARVGPVLGDQASVPDEEGGRRAEPVAAQFVGQDPSPGGQECPVGLARTGGLGRVGGVAPHATSCRSVSVSAISALRRQQSSASQDSIRVKVR